MTLIVGIIATALTLYAFVILARIVLSWLPRRSDTFLSRLYGVLYAVTEPYLGIFRRFLPHGRFGDAAFDLSAVVGLAVLLIVERLVGLL
jgi:YggT family protein